ncbi:hypothetical protein ACGFZJ_34860 [Streptomyces sp. NPDC048253]|uniref:hypothetical protein n=1 Tax=Streptomyces sp. NPDC048253 TaxID=3365524 RepID=UPI0037130C29
MYVLTQGLAAPEATRLREACERTGLPLKEPAAQHRRELAAHVADDLLVAFVAAEADGSAPLELREITREGAYAVLVQSAPTAKGTLAAIRSGAGFVMAAPLGVERLVSFLTYLRDVAAPASAQILDLDETGALTTPSASVRLSDAEAKALRALADRRAVIVPRPDLLRLTGEDPRDVIESLRARFREIGSGAQILKVPHMGFRLVGEVRLKAGA